MSSKQVAVREFKSHLSRYLAEASAGTTIEIASHRKVVARVTGVAPPPTDGLARMAAKALVTCGSGKPAGGRFQLSASGKAVSAMVLEDR